jgi:large subunit ribosomal protein L10
LNKDEKRELVQALKAELADSDLMVVSDYRGLTVEKITLLRNNCRKAGASLKVVKNTLAKKAIPETGFAAAEEYFTGPTVIAVGRGEPVGVLKVLTGFAKDNNVFQIKGGVYQGRRYNTAELAAMATLPPREVLLARMVGSLNAPLTRMVGAIGGPLRGLLGALHAIGDQKKNAA